MNFSRRMRTDLLVALLAAFVTFLGWACENDRLVPAHWRDPIGIGGDGTLVLGFVKATQEGDFPLFRSKEPHRLGAPFGADWNSWPITEEILYWTTGQLARLTGLHPAVAVAMAMAHVLAAIAFYAACRLLGRPRFWSCVFSILFGLTQYIFQRSLGHLVLGYCWHIPLCLVVVSYAFSARGLLKNRVRIFLAVGVSVATGWQNPYFAFVYMQFLVLAGVVQVWRTRRLRAALPAVAAVTLTMFCFLSMQADTLLDGLRTQRGSLAAARSYTDMELYALKPFDLFLPPHWNLPALNGRITDYVQQRVLNGEYPLSYMGLVAGLAALGLAGVLFRDVALRKSLSPLALRYGVPALWMVALGMAGGLLGFGSLLTRVYFLRGANRFSIFIIALVLFFAVETLARGTRRWRTGSRLALAGVLLLATVWDLPPPRQPSADQLYGGMWSSLQTFVSSAESKAGRDAAIFVLPVEDFPETSPLYKEDHYAPLALYLPDSTLRFSYGDMKGDYRDAWQRRVERLPAPQLATELRRLGFRGLVVVRDAYPDNGKALLSQLAAAGYSATATSPAPTNFTFVPLTLPSAPSPAAAVRPETAGITLRKGWNTIVTAPDGSAVLWTEGSAAMGLVQEKASAGPGFLTVRLISLEPRRVQVRFNGATLADLALEPNTETLLEQVPLPLRPGENVLEIHTDRPGTRVSALDRRIVAVCLKDLEISGLTPSTREQVDRVERNTARVPASELAATDPSAWRDKTRLEARDAAGNRWRESRAMADSAPLQGTAGWPVAKMELLPAGRRFEVRFRVTPAAAQTSDFAPVFSCHGLNLRGVTFEKVAGQPDLFQLALGTGTTYLPVGDPVRLEPGKSYVCALGVTENTLELTVTGNGADSKLVRSLAGIPPFSTDRWCWGNWPLGGRPFAGRIELLALQGSPPLPAEAGKPEKQAPRAP